MNASKLAKSVLNAIHLLVLLLVAATGILFARDLHAQNPDFQTTMNLLVQDQLNNADLEILSAAIRPCVGFQVYTSLPPKCRTSDGTFTPINEFPSNTIYVPGPK